jgi:putative sterol carrier protein
MLGRRAVGANLLYPAPLMSPGAGDRRSSRTEEGKLAAVSQYQFLSEEWMGEARKIRAEYEGKAPEIPVSVRMNQVITDVPFGDGVINAHLDTSAGQMELELGHLETPDLTVTMEYATARAILVDGDAAAAMQAFMGGRIKVDGDITKMMALQAAGAGAVDPVAAEIAQRLQSITA